jgi:addiction module RelE/StbE family toxin
MYKILASETFQRQFKKIEKKFKYNILEGLNNLSEDPFTPRTGADILPVKGTKSQKYRLRVGDYRIIYCVEEDIVKVIEVFTRGRDYR